MCDSAVIEIPPQAEAQPTADDAADQQPHYGVRFAVLLLLCNTALFFRGCSATGAAFTMGLPLPAAEFRQDESQRNMSVTDGSPLALLLNALIVAVIGIPLYLFGPLRKVVLHRRVLIAAGISYVAFNMAVIWPTLWMNTTFALQAWLVDLLLGDECRIWVMDIFSRCYFLAHSAVVLVICYAGKRVWNRFVATSGERWWQFQLSGIFVIMTIACLLIGLIMIMILS
jgi:hypothetical protein